MRCQARRIERNVGLNLCALAITLCEVFPGDNPQFYAGMAQGFSELEPRIFEANGGPGQKN